MPHHRPPLRRHAPRRRRGPGVQVAPALLVVALLLATPGPDAAAQSAQSAEALPPALAPLAPEDVARVNGEVLGLDLFERYLSTVYARLPEGDRALQQLLVERIVERRATELGVTVRAAEVDALRDELLDRARAAGEDAADLEARLADGSTLRDGLRLAVLQRAVVAAERRVARAEVSDAELQTWLGTALAEAALQEHPLTDALAASWRHGELSRVDVGQRIAALLPDEELEGVLTELIGIRVIEHRATALGVSFTAEVAARELAERERLLAMHPSTAGVSYADYLDQVLKRSQAELISSPKFKAEVLLSLMVEAAWDEPRLMGLFEDQRAVFEERYGEDVDYATARPGVLKAARQRTYRQMLEAATIVRRF